jgi:hypothetical protein
MKFMNSVETGDDTDLSVTEVIIEFEDDAARRRSGYNYNKTSIRDTDLTDLDKILLIWTDIYALNTEKIKK